MKTLITLAAMMMVALTFGTAYADDDRIPYPGMVIAPVPHSTYDWSLKGQAAADHLASYTNDEAPLLGSNSDISKAFAGPETVLADRTKKGSAAGGLAKEDENTRIWDNLFGAPGGSDLP